MIDPIAVDQRQVSATSHDAAGRPTHGAIGTGDVDPQIAMSRDDDSYASLRTRRMLERYWSA